MDLLHRAEGKGDFALWAEVPPENHFYRWQDMFFSSFTAIFTQREDNFEPQKNVHTHNYWI